MYSQNLEEKYILDYFKDFKGNLLDIGANDGKTLSNSLALIKRGWKGVLVEPSPVAFKRLEELYKDEYDICLFEKAIANKDGKCILHQSGKLATNRFKGQDVSLISTILDKELERWTKWKNKLEWKDIEVETWTFKTLMENSPIKKFEFITIDAEGMDWDILQQINLKEVDCHLICLELIKKNNLKDYQRFADYLIPQGYKEWQRTADNLLFAL